MAQRRRGGSGCGPSGAAGRANAPNAPHHGLRAGANTRESFDVFEAALDALLIPVALVDYETATTSITWVNQAFSNAVMRTSASLLGRPWRELLTLQREEPAAFVHAELANMRARMVVTLHREDGSTVEAALSLIPLALTPHALRALVIDVLRPEEQARQRSEDAQAEAEHAIDQLLLLGTVSTALSSTLDVHDGLRRLAATVVPLVADWCVVDLLQESGSVHRVAIAHREPTRTRASDVEYELAMLPNESASSLARVLHGEDPILLRKFAAPQQADCELHRKQLELFQELGAGSALVAGLQARGRVLGAITLVRMAGSAPFRPRDLDLADALARRAALALDNARLYAGQRQMAEVLQRSLLTRLPVVDGMQLAARYVPAHAAAEVGGDWYDAFTLPDGHLALVIGDVMGHDLKAAAAMGQLRSLLRASAWVPSLAVGAALDRLDLLIQGLQAAELASAILGRVEILGDATGIFCWANAGHPPPLLIHTDGRTEFLEPNEGMVLGVMPGGSRPESEAVLPAGSTLLLYTDGLVERREEELGIGMARLQRCAGELRRLPLEDFCDRLLACSVTTAGADDVALLALRLIPKATSFNEAPGATA